MHCEVCKQAISFPKRRGVFVHAHCQYIRLDKLNAIKELEQKFAGISEKDMVEGYHPLPLNVSDKVLARLVLDRQ